MNATLIRARDLVSDAAADASAIDAKDIATKLAIAGQLIQQEMDRQQDSEPKPESAALRPVLSPPLSASGRRKKK